VEDRPSHLHGERAAADHVRRRCEREGGGQREPTLARRQSASLGGDHVQARPRVREDLPDTAVAQDAVEGGREDGGHLARRWPRGAALLVDVGVVSARQRRERIALGEAGHAPAADRGPDQVQRARAVPVPCRQELAEEEPVEAGDGEPLGAAGGARQDVDVVGLQAPRPDDAQRLGAGPQGQRRRGRGHAGIWRYIPRPWPPSPPS
jgi:hypothetical protein